MTKITLEVDRDEKSSTWGYVAESLFQGESMSQLSRMVLDEALRVFRPKALQFINNVSVSHDLNKEPHELFVNYRTSFVSADFDDAEESLTPLGLYLKEVDGWLLNPENEDEGDAAWTSVLEENYWNPEWPMPLRMRLEWEPTNPPFGLTVVCTADSNEQLVHLLMHNRFDEIVAGMRTIIEDFVNRKVQEILQLSH